MELFKLFGTIAVKNDEANEKIDDTTEKAEKSQGKLGNVFEKVGSATVKVGKAVAVGIGVVASGVAAMTSLAVKNYAEYEQLVGGVETLFKESSDKVVQYANDAYKTAGLSANEYMDTVTSFSASLLQSLGGDTEKAADYANMAIVDMSDNANKMGTDMASIQNAYQGFAKQNYTMLDNLKLGYGGTKEEMQRLLEDAEKISGFKYDLSSYADIVDAIHVVQTEMDITGTTQKEAATTIQGSIGMMKSAWTNFLTGMSDSEQDFDQLLGNLVDSVVTFADNLIPRIAETIPRLVEGITQVVQTLSGYIPGIIEELLPAIIEGSTNIISGIVEILPKLVDTIVESLPMFIEGIVQIMDGIISALPSIIETLVSALPQILPLLIDGTVQLIISLAEALPEMIEAIIAVLPDLIMSIVDAIVENLPLLIDATIQLITALAEALPEMIPPLVEILPDVFTTIGEALVENVPVLLESIGEMLETIGESIYETLSKSGEKQAEIVVGIWEDIKGGIVEKISEIKGKISEKFELIKSTISEKLNSAKEKVSEIFENIKENISEKITSAKEKVEEVFGDIKEKISEKLTDAKEKVTEIFGDIKDKISDKIEDAKETVQDGLDAIKGFFDNLKLKLPDIKLPHFKLSGEFNLKEGSVPSLGVDWYAKGGIMRNPTAFGINGNNLMVGGESGDEAIAPIDLLQGYVRQAVLDANADNDTSQIIELLMRVIELLVSINNKETTIRLNERELGRAVRKYA